MRFKFKVCMIIIIIQVCNCYYEIYRYLPIAIPIDRSKSKYSLFEILFGVRVSKGSEKVEQEERTDETY